MSSNPLRLKYLLQKYLEGACSRRELKEFWRLMSELSEDDLIDTELEAFWNRNEQGSATGVNLDKAFGRLKEKAEQQEIDYTRIVPARTRRIRRLAIAAGVAGVLLASWWLFRSRPASRQQPVELATKRSAGHQVINLPDGTIVTLNYDSKLDYPLAFNGQSREVYLTGEAFFDVRHDPAKSFIVHTGALTVRVLGTSFNIKAYSGEENIAVTVANGRVQVQQTDTKRSLGVLSQGDQLIVGRSGDHATLVRADLPKVMEWKKEDLIFDNNTFDEAAVLIGNYFGVELRFRNEALRNCRFSGNFSNDSLDHVLDIVCELTRSKWRRENEKLIWLEGEGCK